MKVNLLLNNIGDARSGYLNISPLLTDKQVMEAMGLLYRSNVFNLNETVDGGELQELVAHDILDFAPGDQADHVLDNWLSKLAHGGTLSLSVVDLREVARAYMRDQLSLEDANVLLYGEPGSSLRKQSVFTLAALVEVLTNKGYKVLQKRVTNFRAYVTVERP